jgi:hypothetical protein
MKDAGLADTDNHDMNYSLTEYARDALKKRRIVQEWLERAFTTPESVERDTVDPELEHRLARIPEFGGRTLRVIVNVQVLPPRIVTACFDRRRK